MNIVISGHHLEITPAIREYVSSKLARVMRHTDQVIGANVLLTVGNDKEKSQKAEVSLRMKGKDIFVEHQNVDLYAAIDELVDKLDRQVVKYKEKLQNFPHESVRYEASPEQ